MSDFQVYLVIAFFLIMLFFTVMAVIEMTDMHKLDYDTPVMYNGSVAQFG